MLSSSQLEAYAEQGFVVLDDLFDDARCQAWRAASDAVAVELAGAAENGKCYQLDGNRFVDIGHTTVQFEHDGGSGEIRVVEPVNDWSEPLDALIDAPELVGPMRQLLGSTELSLWTAKLNYKPAGVGSGFGWHQDSPYWIHDHDDVGNLPNVMVAFDDAFVGNGCIEVIAGSHRQGCLPGLEDGSQLEGFYTHPRFIEDAQRVRVEMHAGSAVFFNPHIIHGSGLNRSVSPRRAIIITYQAGHLAALKSRVVRPIAGEA